ncbi:MAG: class I SAM-dependent methyltransferase, partial [Pseudomonadota bacterium]|nr:class I SAM-dependent methyltransferase [Pseudomonadota bacterium]
VDLFAAPGDSDISHWVDFAALGHAAARAGARLVGPMSQGRFLMRIGLSTRAEQAAQHATPEARRALLAAIDRLTSPAQMGEVFKVALLLPPGEGVPPGFEDVEA